SRARRSYSRPGLHHPQVSERAGLRGLRGGALRDPCRGEAEDLDLTAAARPPPPPPPPPPALPPPGEGNACEGVLPTGTTFCSLSVRERRCFLPARFCRYVPLSRWREGDGRGDR